MLEIRAMGLGKELTGNTLQDEQRTSWTCGLRLGFEVGEQLG